MNKILSLIIIFAAFSAQMNAADTLTVRIKGMRCDDCAHKVQTALSQDAGIEDITFNLERRTATIVYNPATTSKENIETTLEATKRYKASLYSKDEVIRRGIGQRIDDMHCQKCADRIIAGLSSVEGIDSLAPHLDKQYFFIRYDANRTTKADIRAKLNSLGFTPVNYYTSNKIEWLYLVLPEVQANQETLDAVLALDGVEDVNVNTMRKTMAITFFNDETTEEKLLAAIKDAGINATLPEPHVCKEEQK